MAHEKEKRVIFRVLLTKTLVNRKVFTSGIFSDTGCFSSWNRAINDLVGDGYIKEDICECSNKGKHAKGEPVRENTIHILSLTAKGYEYVRSHPIPGVGWSYFLETGNQDDSENFIGEEVITSQMSRWEKMRYTDITDIMVMVEKIGGREIVSDVRVRHKVKVLKNRPGAPAAAAEHAPRENVPEASRDLHREGGDGETLVFGEIEIGEEGNALPAYEGGAPVAGNAASPRETGGKIKKGFRVADEVEKARERFYGLYRIDRRQFTVGNLVFLAKHILDAGNAERKGWALKDLDTGFGQMDGAIVSVIRVLLVYSQRNLRKITWRSKAAKADLELLDYILNGYLKEHEPEIGIPAVRDRAAVCFVWSPTNFENFFDTVMENRDFGAGLDNFFVVPRNGDGLEELSHIMSTDVNAEADRVKEKIGEKDGYAPAAGMGVNTALFPFINEDYGNYVSILNTIDVLALKRILRAAEGDTDHKYELQCRKWMIPYIERIVKKYKNVITASIADDGDCGPRAPFEEEIRRETEFSGIAEDYRSAKNIGELYALAEDRAKADRGGSIRSSSSSG